MVPFERYIAPSVRIARLRTAVVALIMVWSWLSLATALPLRAQAETPGPSGLASEDSLPDEGMSADEGAAGTPEDPAGKARIPSWLQARRVETPLYAGPEGRARAGSVPQWTFLRVTAVDEHRLEVQSVSGVSPAAGWVEPSDVQPAEPAEGWLEIARPGPLVAGSQSGAPTVGELGAGTLVRRVGDEAGERVPVRVYTADFGNLAATGWVARDLTRAADPPTAGVLPTADAPFDGNPFASRPQALVDEIAEAARSAGATAIPVSVTVAQAILESDWGDSVLSRVGRNYFGIKATGRMGNDGVVWFTTAEYDAVGQRYEDVEPFRAYKSLGDSVADHHRLLAESPDYRGAMAATGDSREFARQLQAAGYSTDPNYAEKLIDLLDRYELERFD